MDEDKKKEEKVQGAAVGKPEDTPKGNQHQSSALIESANTAAERLEKATAEAKTERALREEEEVRRKLGGTTEAGKPNEKQQEETPQQYKDRVMRNLL